MRDVTLVVVGSVTLSQPVVTPSVHEGRWQPPTLIMALLNFHRHAHKRKQVGKEKLLLPRSPIQILPLDFFFPFERTKASAGLAATVPLLMVSKPLEVNKASLLMPNLWPRGDGEQRSPKRPSIASHFLPSQECVMIRVILLK